MRNNILCVSLFFLIISCESDDGQRKELSLDGCESGILTDTSKVESSLVGSWVMADVICGLCGPTNTSTEPSEVEVKFKNDKTFEILIDGKISSAGEWAVEDFDSFVQINVNPETTYLTNAFTMCDNELLTLDWTYKDLLQVKYAKLE